MSGLIRPKRPKAPGWVRLENPPQWVSLGYDAEAWTHQGAHLYVISAVEVASDKDGIDRGPEYHLSVSSTKGYSPSRCTSADALWMLAQFDVTDAEEDNHVPNGQVRNFWRPVADHLSGMQCACKEDEPAILLNKGDYVWRPA